MKEMKGKKVIVRGDRSGVTFGTLMEREGQEVKLADSRAGLFAPNVLTK